MDISALFDGRRMLEILLVALSTPRVGVAPLVSLEECGRPLPDQNFKFDKNQPAMTQKRFTQGRRSQR